MSHCDIDFYFYWFLVIKSEHWNFMGLYSVREEVYLRGISGFCLFTRVRRKGQKINMEKPKNYIYVFLVGANVVGAVWKFWILAFLEALKTKFKRFLKKHCCFIKRWREWPLCHQPLYTDPVYLFTVFLFYLYSCSNIIVKLITKTKAMAVIQN